MPTLEIFEYEMDTLSHEQPIYWTSKTLRRARIDYKDSHIEAVTNFIEEENKKAAELGTEDYLIQNGNKFNGLLTLVNYIILWNDVEGTTLQPFQEAKDTISRLLMELENKRHE